MHVTTGTVRVRRSQRDAMAHLPSFLDGLLQKFLQGGLLFVVLRHHLVHLGAVSFLHRVLILSGKGHVSLTVCVCRSERAGGNTFGDNGELQLICCCSCCCCLHVLFSKQTDSLKRTEHQPLEMSQHL